MPRPPLNPPLSPPRPPLNIPPGPPRSIIPPPLPPLIPPGPPLPRSPPEGEGNLQSGESRSATRPPFPAQCGPVAARRVVRRSAAGPPRTVKDAPVGTAGTQPSRAPGWHLLSCGGTRRLVDGSKNCRAGRHGAHPEGSAGEQGGQSSALEKGLCCREPRGSGSAAPKSG